MARPFQEIFAKQIPYILKHFAITCRMQSMAAVIDANSLNLKAARVSAWMNVLFQHSYIRNFPSCKMKRCAKPCGPGAQNDYVWPIHQMSE
jgi:hypothetical protein